MIRAGSSEKNLGILCSDSAIQPYQ